MSENGLSNKRFLDKSGIQTFIFQTFTVLTILFQASLMLEVTYQSPFSCDEDSLPESEDDDEDPAFDPSYPSRRPDGSIGSGTSSEITRLDI